MMGRHVLDEYPIEKFIDDAMDLAASVYSFHDRFEIEQVDNEAHMIQTMLARICLLSEEVGEHARAVNRGQAVDAMLEVVVTVKERSADTLGVCPRIRSWRRKPPRNNLLTVIWTLSWSN